MIIHQGNDECISLRDSAMAVDIADGFIDSPLVQHGQTFFPN